MVNTCWVDAFGKDTWDCWDCVTIWVVLEDALLLVLFAVISLFAGVPESALFKSWGLTNTGILSRVSALTTEFSWLVVTVCTFPGMAVFPCWLLKWWSVCSQFCSPFKLSWEFDTKEFSLCPAKLTWGVLSVLFIL